MTYSATYTHTNTTDTLYAWPIADPPWTDAGIIVGDDSITPGTFVFTDLQDGVNYYVCIQAGAEPAEGDVQDAIILAPTVPDPSSATTNIVNRTVDDTTPIMFSFPVTGATITAQASKNNGAYVACGGTVSFVRTESGKHYYALAFDASDRLTEGGTVRYAFTDGTYTRYVPVYFLAGNAALEDEIAKIPRSASAVVAGGPVERNKISADGDTLVETIT